MQNEGVLAGLRVLVVEDEPIVAWDLAETLETYGCEIVGPAYDLAQAKELSRERTVDGAVLDVNLGSDKVFPLADSLAAVPIPFCYVTGYGVAGLRPQDLQHPVLQKPVDTGRLVQVVQNWRPAGARPNEPDSA
jgi:DNA-binding NtrC family response regulator